VGRIEGERVGSRRLTLRELGMVEVVIISHKEAVASGINRYFTGVPCVRGHISERTTKGRCCMECLRENAKERRQQPGAQEKHNAFRRTPAQRAAQKEQMRRWRLAHPEEWKAIAAKSRSKPEIKKKRNDRQQTPEGRELNVKQAKQWRENNPEGYRAINAKARAVREGRIRSSDAHHTSEDLTRIYKMQKGKCAYCRRPLRDKYQVDHIIPLSGGGSNAAYNIQLCCESTTEKRSCNQMKRDRHPIEFAQSLGLLL
jgi:5-methylcytosine-specific restriction endonuclease McrA